MLCSDGYNIYDSSANYIEGGDTIIPLDYYTAHSGFSVLSQSSIFLSMDSGIFYLVTPTMSNSRYLDCQTNNNCFFDLLFYNVIDMKANGGSGKVIKRMQPLMQNAILSKTQMMACRHSNGKDWWLLKQGGDSNIVYKFLFTQDSDYDKGKQIFTDPIWGIWDLQGQSVFTKDGRQYATTNQSSSTGKVFIADFDRCYGLLSNPQIIEAPIASMHDPADSTITDRLPVGLAYSPNGKLLYVMCQYNIWQYDFQDSSWFHVAGIDTSWVKFQLYNASYLGPDDKLYVGNFGGTSKQMSVIENPDVKGAGCNFCPRCLRLDTLINGYVSTPPCMPNYALGAQDCWPLATNDINAPATSIEVYPNPTNLQLNIKYRGTNDTKMQIVNMWGVVVKEIFLSKAVQHVLTSIESLMPGVYIYRQVENKTVLNTGKLIITN
jgi:hypothetical protein